MSSHPEIAPWAPAAAAIGPGRHSEEAWSPQPKDLLPTPPQCLGFSKRLSQLLFPFRRLGERGAVVRERRDPEGAVPRGWAQGATAPPDRVVLLPLQGLGCGGGGSRPPAPPGPSQPFKRPRGGDIPVPLGPPGLPPVRPVLAASPVRPVHPARPPAGPTSQPWTPSRRRCRC